MNKYLVKLKPIDKYFFGSILSFGKDNSEYILFSNLFPQQTSLLGMLRKEILVQSELIKYDMKYGKDEIMKMKEFIGEKSFDATEKIEQDFGKVKKVSSVYIYKEDDGFYTSTPKNHNSITNKYQPFEVEEKDFIKKCSQNFFLFKEYDSKNYEKESFMNINNGSIIDFSDIFSESIEIGIGRSQNKSTKKNGFFKKRKYKLNNGFNFAFTIELECELKDSIVQVGDKNSLFKMKVQKMENTKYNIFEEINVDNKNFIILLSDSFIDEEIIRENFGIYENIQFNNWKTRSGKYKFNSNGSRIFNLLKKGSVIYCKPEEKRKMVEKITGNANYTKCGFNNVI